MIPGPINLVFADRFFSILESLGFFVLTWFFPFKNKDKSKWRLQSKTVPPLGRIFQNSKINPHFLFTFSFHFRSESRRPVDRVGSTFSTCVLVKTTTVHPTWPSLRTQVASAWPHRGRKGAVSQAPSRPCRKPYGRVVVVS